MKHLTRGELSLVGWVLLAGIIEFLRLLLGIKVVQVSEPLVETVSRRQELVSVTQMVLAELCGGVALRFQHLGQQRVFFLDSLLRTGEPDSSHAAPQRNHARHERGSSRGATRLSVVVGKDRPMFG